MSRDSGIGKFVAGLAIGVGLGVLFAPKKGSETRAELKAKLEELWHKAKELDMAEIRGNIERKIADIKAELADLDSEKVKKIAKEKAKQIQEKCEALVKYVMEKGTPIMEKTAVAIKEKAVKVAQEVIDRCGQEEAKEA